jgi:hypothetical protein
MASCCQRCHVCAQPTFSFFLGHQVLDVSRNNVRQLPAWLPSRLTGLLALRLHSNRLEALSQELKQLTALQVSGGFGSQHTCQSPAAVGERQTCERMPTP